MVVSGGDIHNGGESDGTLKSLGILAMAVTLSLYVIVGNSKLCCCS